MKSLASIAGRAAIVFAIAVVAAVFAAPASAAPTHYVTMTDGAKIAINVKVPPHCVIQKCPAYFEMSGYESGSDEGKTPAGHLADQTGLPFPLQTGTREAHASKFEDRYVTVLASVRGTGCSSGEFDLFSLRSALDGKEVIDKWIAKQPWSNGDVAIFGHSYSGITGAFVASTRPVHLKAASISGLIGDTYRDIIYPGGVTNYGFPLLWTGAIRVAYDVGGGTLGGLYPVEDTSAQCAANQAERRRALLEDPLIHGLDDTDTNWFSSRSLVNYVDRINVPVHVTSAYQDEQTGPRGPTYVYDKLSGSVSKRLVLVNGVHGTNTNADLFKDRMAWLDYWMLNKSSADLGMKSGNTTLSSVFGPKTTPTKSSRVVLGYQGDNKAVGEVKSNGYPLAQTQWTDLYATDGNKLLFEQDSIEPGTASWINGSHRQSYAYQAGVNTGGEVSSPTGPDEARAGHVPVQRPDRDRRPDQRDAVHVVDRAGHRGVRAAARPRSRRDAPLPQPRHAPHEPRARSTRTSPRRRTTATSTARGGPTRTA